MADTTYTQTTASSEQFADLQLHLVRFIHRMFTLRKRRLLEILDLAGLAPTDLAFFPRQFTMEFIGVLAVMDFEIRGHLDTLPSDLRDPYHLWKEMWSAFLTDPDNYAGGDRGERLFLRVCEVWLVKFSPVSGQFQGVCFEQTDIRISSEAVDSLVDLLLAAVNVDTDGGVQ